MDIRFLKGLAFVIFIMSFMAPILYSGLSEFRTNRIPEEIIYPLCWVGGLFSGVFWLTMAEILKKLEHLKSAELHKIEKIEEICRKLPE